MKWKYIYNTGQELSNDFAKQIRSVFLDGFGFPPDANAWSIEGVKKDFRISNLLAILQDEITKKIFGYSMFYIPENPLFDDKYILWNNATALRQEIHGKGYYSLGFFHEVVKKFPDKQIGWAGGRSQNLLIYLRYSKLGKLFPFAEQYNTDEGKQLMTFLKRNVDEVHSQAVNENNGIAFNVYKEGVLGDFRDDIVDTKIFEEKLKKWNFNRENGDTLVVCVKLNSIKL